MKTKTLTFDHPTYQTGHNFTQIDFAPIPEVIQALDGIGPIGSFPIADWTIDVTPYAHHVAVFSIKNSQGTPLVRCYASYVKDVAKAGIVSELILSELKEQAARREVAPPFGDVLSQLPLFSGPFLLAVLLPTTPAVGEEVSMLGDAERCIYWHLHRFYGEG